MTLGPVRVMGAGVVVMLCVGEVSSTLSIYIYIILLYFLWYIIVSCPLLTDPNNGMINCSLGDDGVPSYEDTCSYTCDIGYQLNGSDTRTCQSDGSWSGTNAMCSRGK